MAKGKFFFPESDSLKIVSIILISGLKILCYSNSGYYLMSSNPLTCSNKLDCSKTAGTQRLSSLLTFSFPFEKLQILKDMRASRYRATCLIYRRSSNSQSSIFCRDSSRSPPSSWPNESLKASCTQRAVATSFTFLL